MARTLNSPINDQRAELTYLYEIHHSGGGSPLRVTNSSADITALTFTWTAVGGALLHSPTVEGSDRKGHGLDLTLYGVDQTIIQQIQNNQFRGRVVRIYLLHFDPDTGVQDTPDLIFLGRQNGDFRVKETRDLQSQESGGRVEVTTRITADLAGVNIKNSTRCNVHSHEELLRRSGVVSPDDKFFERVLSLEDKEIFWGRDTPEAPGGGSGRGGWIDDRESGTSQILEELL